MHAPFPGENLLTRKAPLSMPVAYFSVSSLRCAAYAAHMMRFCTLSIFTICIYATYCMSVRCDADWQSILVGHLSLSVSFVTTSKL